MYQIKMENCNNIIQGELTIENGKLNIFYGINGTGKTTIAKAIEFSKEPQKIKELQSFFERRSGICLNQSGNWKDIGI